MLLQADSLRLTFTSQRGDPVRALDNVSLDLRAGETVGLVGESGSGKTTLGKTLLRLYRPDSGRILFAGKDLANLGDGALQPHRRALQMIFQDPLASFNPRFRLGDSVGLPMKLHGLATGAALRRAVEAGFAEVGLDPALTRRYPHELSGGQLQRVAIARAVGLRPQLIVADEAVSKLDVSVRAQILNLIRDLKTRHGLAMLFITHDLGVARYLSDRVAVMHFGRIVESGPAAEVFSEPRHPYTRRLVSAREGHAGGADDTSAVALAAAASCLYHPRCPRRIEACTQSRPPLQAIAEGYKAACFNPDFARRKLSQGATLDAREDTRPLDT